jgi:hypothetical protein
MSQRFTLIDAGTAHSLEASVRDGRVALSPAAVNETLGWELKPEGLCRGDVCVPVRDADGLQSDVGLDLEVLADKLGRPLALDAAAGAAALGIATSDLADRMASLQAPDFELPDLSGKPHRLSEHRGKKVLLIAYASW